MRQPEQPCNDGIPVGFDPSAIESPPLPDRPWRITSLALDVAGSCNMACRYCAEAATQPERHPMSDDMVNACWFFLRGGDRLRRGVSIRFGSGEPLLGLAALRRVAALIEQARQSGEDELPEVFLTTNGTLITPEVADWLVTTGWHVKISLDGPASIHDSWRVFPGGHPTYACLAPIVADLACRIPDRLSVTAVLCHGTDPALVFESIAALGVKRIELVPVAHHKPAIQLDSEDIERYEAFVKAYARCFLTSGWQQTPILIRFADRVTRVMGYGAWRVPCGAGRSFLGVSPDGDLYPCFRFIGIEKYQLGHITTGLDQEAAIAFQHGPGRPYDQREPCIQCWAAPLCGGPCFACAELFGQDGAPLATHCAYTLADSRAAVWLVQRLRKRAPRRLLTFLSRSVVAHVYQSVIDQTARTLSL